MISSRIIFLNQNGFIKSRSVKYYISYEVLISKEVKDGNVAIKIDITKALDIIN